MKNILLVLLLLNFASVKAQDDTVNVYSQPPIPVEIMGGVNSSMFQMVVTKQIGGMNSKFWFINLTNYEVDYDVQTPDIYYIQNLISYNFYKSFSLGAGTNFKSFDVVKPVIIASYSLYRNSVSLYIQPSYEIHRTGVFELYTMFEWGPFNNKKVQPYFRLEGYASGKDEHSFSYLYGRLGLQYKIFRFGPAINAQYFGNNFDDNINWGGFVNVLIK